MKCFAITAGIKAYNLIIKKKKKKHDKIVLLRKGKLNTIEVLVSIALINSYFIHDGIETAVDNDGILWLNISKNENENMKIYEKLQ